MYTLGYYWVAYILLLAGTSSLSQQLCFRNMLVINQLTMYNVPETTIRWYYQLVVDLLVVYKLETNCNVLKTVRISGSWGFFGQHFGWFLFSLAIQNPSTVCQFPATDLRWIFQQGIHSFCLIRKVKKRFTPSWNRSQICLFRKQLPYLAGRLVGLKSSLCKSSLYECLLVIRLILLLAAVTGLYCPIIHFFLVIVAIYFSICLFFLLILFSAEFVS